MDFVSVGHDSILRSKRTYPCKELVFHRVARRSIKCLRVKLQLTALTDSDHIVAAPLDDEREQR